MLKQFKLIILIGMDIIQHLGGVNISKAGHVTLTPERLSIEILIKKHFL